MDLIRTFLRDVRPGDTILDIGANIGGYTKTFREQHPDAIIHAFEPVPVVYEELVKTHGADPKTFCWRLGVGATKEIAEGVAVHEAWTINKPGATLRGRNATYGADIFDMQVVTVDSFLAERTAGKSTVSAIKIDTDGYDFRVLQGAAETILKFRPRILIEFGYCITDIDGPDAVEAMLQWICGMFAYHVYEAGGAQVNPQFFHEWYPFRTTADFLLVPGEQELDPQS